MFPYNPYDFYVPDAPLFELSSDDVQDGVTLPAAQLSKVYNVPGGEDKSPSLSWKGFPPETKSFVVTCYDPDAPVVSGFWHWIVYNLPATTTSLPKSAGDRPSDDPSDGTKTGLLPSGSQMIKNDAGWKGYLGAAAPPGHGPHRYIFAVFALNVESLQLDSDTASPAVCHSRMRNAVIGKAFIAPIFER